MPSSITRKPHIYLFFGTDSFSMLQRVAIWKREFIAKYGAHNCVTLDCDDAASGEPPSELLIKNALHASSLFGTTKLVIFKNAFSKQTKKTLADLISNELESVPLTHFIVFADGSVDARSILSKKIASLEKDGRAGREEFTAPIGHDLVTWVQRRVASSNGAIDHAAAERLAALLDASTHPGAFSPEPPDLWRVTSELHKLLAFAQGRAIVTDDVDLLSTREVDAHIFSFIDALLSGDTKRARTLAATLLPPRASHAVNAVGLCVMLQHQFRAFCIVKSLSTTGTPDADIAQKLSWNPKRVWVVKKKLAHLSPEDVLSAYRELIAMEVSIKKGAGHPGLLLERVIQAVTTRA